MTPYEIMKASVLKSQAKEENTRKQSGEMSAYDIMKNAITVKPPAPTPQLLPPPSSIEMPYTPTTMLGAVARGFGGGLKQGARDVGVTAAKSIVNVPETLVGVADIATRPIQAIGSKLATGRVSLGLIGKGLESAGLDFKTTQELLSTVYSDEQQRAMRNVEDAEGVGGTLKELAKNPTVPVHSALQSILSMALGSTVSGPLASIGVNPTIAGAIGEGLITAGQAQESIRQGTKSGTTTPKQTALAAGSGIVTAAIGAGSGRVAGKLGIADPETVAAAGVSTASKKKLVSRILGGMVTEGLLEEMPQSANEQIAQNVATGKPWYEGVKKGAVQGAVVGSVMGAGSNVMSGQRNSADDISEWAAQNEGVVKELLSKPDPSSRTAFEDSGLPRMGRAERIAIVNALKERNSSEPKFPEQGSVIPHSETTPNATLPLNAETQAQVEKVQEEVAAQEPVVEGSGINETVVEKPEPVAETVAEPPKKTAKEKAAEGVAKLKAIREAKAPKPVETEPTVAPVASEPVIAPEVAPEAAKPVDEAVAKRKRGKKVKEVAEVQPEPIATELQPTATKETVATDVAIEDTTKAKKQGKAVKTVAETPETAKKSGGWHSIEKADNARRANEWSRRQMTPAQQEVDDKRNAKIKEALVAGKTAQEVSDIYDSFKDEFSKAKASSSPSPADERKQGKKVAPTVKDSLTVQPTAPAPVKVETDGKVTYIAPATGKASRWVKVNGEWYQSDKSGKVKGKPLEPMKLRDALDEQLQKEQGTQSAPVKVETTLDSKGRSPERLAQMTENARALKEASAKEGMLPKPTVKESATARAEAPVKVETKDNGDKVISVPKADKPSTTPAMQRAYLEAEIDKAMAQVPEGGSKDRVTIEVPNDGTYNVINSKEALQSLRDRVPKMFPNKAPRAGIEDKGGNSSWHMKPVEVRNQVVANPKLIPQYRVQLENGIYSDKDTEHIKQGIVLAEEAIAEIKKAKAEGVNIEFVQSVDALPEDVRVMVEKASRKSFGMQQIDGDTSKVEGVYYNGKTYIIGSNVSEGRVQSVIREEVAHSKLDSKKGKELIDSFRQRMTENDKKALQKEGYRQQKGESDSDYEARLANEFIAKQSKKNTTVWTELVDSVKAFLETVGVRDLTNEEAARVILRMVKNEGSGETSGVLHLSLAPSTEQEESEYEAMSAYFQSELDSGTTLDEIREMASISEDDAFTLYAERFIEENEPKDVPSTPDRVSGLKRSIVDAERKEMGMKPEDDSGERPWDEVVMPEAKEALKNNPSAGDKLVDSLTKKARPLEDWEVALLNITKQNRWDELVEANKSGDKDERETALERWNEFFDAAARGKSKSFTMMGRGLAALNMTIDQRLELVNMAEEYQAITGEVVEPGTETYDTLKRISEDFKSRTSMLEKETERLQAENEVLLKSIRSQVNQVIYEDNAGIEKALIGKKNAKRKKVSTAAKTFSEKTSSLGDRLIEEAMASMNLRRARVSAGVDPMVLVDLSKLGAGYMLKGVSNISERIAQAYGAEISDADMKKIMDKAEKISAKEKARLLSESKVEMEPVEEGVTLQDLDLKAIFKEQADQGIEKFEDALKNVGEEVREAGLDVTDEQIRDEFDGYNKEPRELSKEPADRIMSQYRQVGQLCSKIDVARKGQKPHKVGSPRFPMGQEARDSKKKLDSLLKELDAKLKELGLYEGGPTDIASAIDSAKTRMRNDIADKKKAIAERKRIVTGTKGIDFSNDPEAIQLRAELDQVNKDYAEAFPKEPLTPEQTLEMLTKQAERNASYWNKRVQDAKSGKFKSTEKVAKPTNAVIEQLKLEAEMSKDEVTRLYDLKYPSQRAIDAIRRRDEAAIKAMKRMIDTKNFSKPRARQADISGDARAMAAHIAREQIKKEYEIIKAQLEWDRMKWGDRALEVFHEIYQAPKSSAYSGDVSNQGRQGAGVGFAQPALWIKVGIEGTKGMNQAYAAKIIQQIKESDGYASGIFDVMKLGLNLSDATGNYKFADEAQIQSKVIEKVPVIRTVIKVSGRDWGGRSNLFRSGLADIILKSTKIGQECLANPNNLTESQVSWLESIGWGINMLTGDSNMKGKGASWFWGAPNWVASVFGTIVHAPTLHALGKGEFNAMWQMEKQYARAHAFIAAVYAISYALPGGPDDDKRNKAKWDPRDNDFGKIYVPFTNIRYNPLGVWAPAIRFVAQEISGQEISRGTVKNLRDWGLFMATPEEKLQKIPYKQGQLEHEVRYAITKLHPFLSTTRNLIMGTNFVGQKTPRMRLLLEGILPLAPISAIEDYMRLPPSQATAEGVMEMIGISNEPDYKSPQYKKFEAKIDTMFYIAQRKAMFEEPTGMTMGDAIELKYRTEAADMLHRATDPTANVGIRQEAKMMLDDIGLADAIWLLKQETKKQQMKRSGKTYADEPEQYTADGALTPFGKRVKRLEQIDAE